MVDWLTGSATFFKQRTCQTSSDLDGPPWWLVRAVVLLPAAAPLSPPTGARGKGVRMASQDERDTSVVAMKSCCSSIQRTRSRTLSGVGGARFICREWILKHHPAVILQSPVHMVVFPRERESHHHGLQERISCKLHDPSAMHIKHMSHKWAHDLEILPVAASQYTLVPRST